MLDTLRRALTGTREYFRAANRAGYGMIDWFRGRYEPALSILEEAMAELLVAEPTNDVDAVWFVPNDPVASMHTHLALARFTAGDTKGAEAQLRLTTECTAALPFPQGAWSHAYATLAHRRGCWWSRAASMRRSKPRTHWSGWPPVTASTAGR